MKHLRGMCALLAALMVTGVLTLGAGASSPVTVTVRGTAVAWTDAQPYVEDGRTMVPVRAAADAMGLDVHWDAARRQVQVSRTYTPETSVYQAELQSGLKEFLLRRTVILEIGRERYTVSNQYAVYDGRTETETRATERTDQMDAAAEIRGGRTYAPIRYVAEQFGYDVLWDAASRTVRIVNEMAVDWSYAWSIDETGQGSMVLAIHTPTNLTAAKITSVTVTATGAGGGSDGPQAIRAADAADTARIQATVGDVQLLDTVRLDYPFEKGRTYSIAFTVSLTKANGASATADGSFQVNLS